MLNLITVMGRLTRDPEVKVLENTDDKVKVVRMCLAVERDRSTDQEKVTDFIDCVAWRNTADFIEKYFSKGSPIIVQGRLETRKYEDKQGNNRKSTEINVRTVNFCAFKKDDQPEEDQPPTEQEHKKERYQELLESQDLPF